MSSKGNKGRIVRVIRILEEYSDVNTPVTAEEIAEMLKNDGIVCERKAIYDDIGILRGMGYEIRTVRGVKRGYRLEHRLFEPGEICMIADAVKSSGFITDGETDSIVRRLGKLVSARQAAKISKRAGIVNSSNNTGESVYNIINSINSAISETRKVRLRYRRYALSIRKPEFTYKEMTVSPYAVLRDSEHYYLICNNEKYDNLMHLRADRIESLEKTDERARHFSEVSEYEQYFDTADYARKAFNMFGGEPCRIDLECNVKLLDQIIEKFGTDIFIRHDLGSDSFRFSTDALISEGLVGWLMQFGGDIKVLSPGCLKADVLSRAEKICGAYEKK